MSKLPGTDIIRFLDGDRWGAIAAKDLAANSLAFVPYGEISDRRPSGGNPGAPVTLEVQGRKTTLWILRPPDFKTNTVESEALGGEHITQRVTCPYWWCVDRADLRGDDAPTLEMMSGTVEVPLGLWRTDVRVLKPAGTSGAFKIITTYLTNPLPVKAGAELFSAEPN